MAKTDLTAQRLRELLNYDPETGLFAGLTKRCGPKSATAGIGWIDTNGYARISIDGRKYWAHRVAFLYMTGEWPKNDVDHIDGNPGNNIWKNLRDVPTSTNVQNVKRASKNSKTGLLGVVETPSGTFNTRIMVNRKTITIGTFATKEMAHNAYIDAKRKMHDGCTI